MITPALSRALPRLQVPVVLAAMANASGGSLAAQVTNGGGFGFIGAALWSKEKLLEEVKACDEQLESNGGAASDQKGQRREYGLGFLGYKLTQLHGKKPSAKPSTSSPTTGSEHSPAIDLIDAALSGRPRAFWLSFATDAEELIGWSRIVRERDAALTAQGHARDDESIKLFIMVGTEKDVETAVRDCKADVVIVQGKGVQRPAFYCKGIITNANIPSGIEAGGHGYTSSPPLSALLTFARTMIDTLPDSHGPRPALLAAGGLATGASLASVLALGADGAVFGTRFLLTPEAIYSDAQKDALINARSSDAIRTMAFDHARGELGWPAGVDGRGLRNTTVDAWDAFDDATRQRDRSGGSGGDDAAYDGFRQRYAQAVSEKDVERVSTWSGTGVGDMHEVKPAREVVRELGAECRAAIERLSNLLR